ncbi:unnamed protein product [Caenorhabditis brenneri]
MSSAPLTYRNVTNVPEYINYEFQLNWICYYVLFMILYSIIPIFIFCKIAHLFLTKIEKLKKNSLRIEIFYSFLLMQFWNIMLVITDFTMFRIPYTTILTRFCAAENPQAFLKTVVFMYFWTVYCSQLFTVLFCALRVGILYSVEKSVTEKIIKLLPPIIIVFGFICALPHYSTDGYCMQMASPFEFGSILIISKFHSSNLIVVYFNLFIYLSVTITITVLNLLMMLKVRRKKLLSINQSFSQNARIERTLTGTMIILLFPMIVSLLISIGEINRILYFSYVLLVRPLFVDVRVHVVTCYFYFTNPIFKRMSPQSSTVVMSRVTL